MKEGLFFSQDTEDEHKVPGWSKAVWRLAELAISWCGRAAREIERGIIGNYHQADGLQGEERKTKKS